jgi:hypothetical protein
MNVPRVFVVSTNARGQKPAGVPSTFRSSRISRSTTSTEYWGLGFNGILVLTEVATDVSDGVDAIVK